MRFVRAAMAAAALAASIVPAAADWQYTRWGMDPAQVKAASGDVARDNPDRRLDAPGFTADLVSPYEGATLPFTAVFLFDAARKLGYVTLKPLGQIACPVIVEALVTNHGPPMGQVDLGHATTMRWDDLDADNLIVYSDLGQGNCTVQYSKLPPTRPNGKGL